LVVSILETEDCVSKESAYQSVTIILLIGPTTKKSETSERRTPVHHGF